MAGATIALKNWIGVLTTAYKNERYGGHGSMHSQYFFGPYALAAKVMGVTYPKLTIVDAEWTNPESNWQGDAVQYKDAIRFYRPLCRILVCCKIYITP